jgi:hypothetical protein
MLISLEPLGTNVFLPGVLLGWELDSELRQRIEQFRDAPPWFFHVVQQAGGLCMSYPECAGMLLRFEGNKKGSLHNADRLIRGFRFMAEDPNLGVLEREYPILRDLVCTRGDAYPLDTLRTLDEFLADFIRLPALESGIEAFLRFRQCNVLEYFADWKALESHLRPESERVGSAYSRNETIVYYVEEANRNDVTRVEELAINEASLANLAACGYNLGLSNPVRAYLLWENSD